MSETVGAAREDLLRTVAAGTAGVVGEAFLQRLVQSVGETFGAGVCWISELVEQRPVARALVCWPPGALPAGEEYSLDRHDLDGYLAVTCPGNDGGPIGYLAVTTERSLEASPDELAALQIFAARIGAELERRKQEDRLLERENALKASRAKVLEAGDEERRRIGRNLHDGAQQRLIALGQFLDVAGRRLAGGDPAEAARLLTLAREQVKEAGDELRALAQGLHPVVLDRGLPTALTTLAMQSTVKLEVASLPDRRLPDAVEATIFYVVAEALSNAVKHARASTVRVAVSLADGLVRATVQDDGVGGADPDAGTGLLGLRGRAEALSGSLAVESPAGGGTTLALTIPVMPWRTPREPFLEFGHEGDGGRGERMLAHVLDGSAGAVLTLAREWDLEGGLPRIGTLLPVQDRHGHRLATVRVTRVTVLAFSEVDAESASAAMGEPTTVDAWRADRWRFYESCRSEIAVLLGETDWRMHEDEPMAAVWFVLA